MIKFLLIPITVYFMSLSTARADSDLIIAADSNFASLTDDFTAGQTIYIKASANSDGSEKRQLNLRDNNYNLLQSFTLEYLGGNEFKKTITAPQTAGYYSLEARIESEGSVSTSVQTIKVGQPNNSSVNINVNSKAEGQTILGNKSSPSVSPVTSPSPSDQTSPSPQTESALSSGSEQPDQNLSLFQKIKEFFESIFKNFWKF